MANIQDIRNQTPKGSNRRDISRITKIARHHTATTGGDFWSFWNNRWRGLGWSTGGYHEIILQDGTVQLCYDPTVITNGVGGHNSTTYHIAMVGNGSFTELQEKVWQERANIAINRFNLTVNDVLGHREFANQSTQCPGIDMNKIRNELRNSSAKGSTPSTSTGGHILRLGSKGEEVRKLQNDLLKAGEELPRFGADGDFGSETEAAVRSFQQKHGLKVDGIAGPKTLGKLAEVLRSSSNKGPVSSPNPGGLILRQGDKGEEVRKLQNDLLKAGEELPRFGADGDFGSETEAAVRSFQQKLGLTVDGIAGPKTLGKLAELLSNSTDKGAVSSPNIGGLILRNGDKGEEVRKLQNDLLKAGEELPRFGADGDFGAETEAAVRSFQQKHGLTVDGIAGPKTLGKLAEVLKKKSSDNSLFKDVPSNHSAYEAIKFVHDKGIMKGFEEGTFRPNQHVTRGELAQIIQNLVNK
ncbi:hypothetical protein BKP45_13180 [Anaerobacillus alkalidiazotrophicus]|uniref:Autolysin n=1 Tax=Anaerobacillus alkalidiazotrophicus TaxID=472963 RepID=A0A1S2M275_9BACI|nr:peptidoglycan-binding protein [Anaerobacillus alkalidiazotrophicus]OIJ18513.1 hypothetical protein BKP45_18895 [Anaerobacillus alkalidiazotrophicus]OIJ19992.1 hypothetical protein BKP45_13180 [Anaerobacillus alkalidiazotrophicus]